MYERTFEGVRVPAVVRCSAAVTLGDLYDELSAQLATLGRPVPRTHSDDATLLYPLQKSLMQAGMGASALLFGGQGRLRFGGVC